MINKSIRKFTVKSTLKSMDDFEVERILQNGIRFADGTEIFSRHRHDFVSHGGIAVDGGLDYIRRVGSIPEGAEDISVYVDEDHEINREYLVWGTYGKDGDQPLKWKKLCDMSTNHIHAVIDNVFSKGSNWRKEIFEEELRYRCNKAGEAEREIPLDALQEAMGDRS